LNRKLEVTIKIGALELVISGKEEGVAWLSEKNGKKKGEVAVCECDLPLLRYMLDVLAYHWKN